MELKFDPTAAAEHLRRLYAPFLAAGGESDRISVGARTPSHGLRVAPWIAEALPCSPSGIDAAVAFAADQTRAGRNVYARPFLIKPSVDPARVLDGDVTRAAAVFTDHDTPAEFEALNAGAGPPPSFVVETGRTPSRRCHVWWLLDEPVVPAEWRAAADVLAAFHGSDTAVADVRTWARLAGSVSQPKAYEPGRIAEPVKLGPDTGRRWTVEALRAASE